MSPPGPAQPAPARRRERGIALAIVLVMIVLLVTASFVFSRQAVLNVTMAENRLAAAEADAAARGGLRLAAALVYVARLQELSDADANPTDPETSLANALAGGQDPWSRIAALPIELESGAQLRLTIEETGGLLNLNALVPQFAPSADDEGALGGGPSESEIDEAVEYLVLVIRHIIDGIESAPEDKLYDPRAIAESLIDWMDPDQASQGGRDENDYYRRQDPPYAARNGPFLHFEEIGLVEGIDPTMLDAMRSYLTVYPIGGRTGIDLNRAEPWVLPLVYAGPSGDRELLRERTVRQILRARLSGKLLCTEQGSDPNCILPSEVGLGEGSIFPAPVLPTPVAVFRVVAEARVGQVTRRLEAVYDTRTAGGPQLLSFRRLRGSS